VVWCGVIWFDVVREFRLATLALPLPVSVGFILVTCGVVV